MVRRGARRTAPVRWHLVAPSVLAGLGFLFLVLAVSAFVGSTGYGVDFGAYYTAAGRLVEGSALYLPQNVQAPFRAGAPGLYVYSPALAVLLMPAALLPFVAAAFGWLLLHLAALVAGCALMPVPRRVRMAGFGIAALSSPLLVDLNLGNVSVFVLLVAVVAWRWLDRPLGSMALAAGLALRPQLGVVVIWWVARQRLRQVAWTITAGLVLLLVTLPFVGIEGYLQFGQVLRNAQVTAVARNGALESTALLLGLPPPLATLASLAGYAVAAAAIVVSLRRDRELSYVVTVSASLLVTPLLWDHYLVLLLVPAAFLASRGRSWALALPLLGWLPQATISLAALAGTLLPLLVLPAREDRVLAPTGPARPSRASPATG
ncbi:MAG: glycosyltransferase 87 family protein [Chloroflexota bacterium]|nr:glycosyltransferase 87 family protein [Chloroflexota bacterium]